MYEISAATTIDGDLPTVWSVATDVAGWPAWDPHEKAARLHGAFQAGTTGWSKPAGGPGTDWTLTEVLPQRRWASACRLPGGGITGVNTFEDVGSGRIRCTKTVHVTGPLVPLFRLHFGRRMRRDFFRTFEALEREAARRAAGRGAETGRPA